MSGVVVQLEKSRKTLLDLSTRNRLLNVPRQSKNAKVIHVVDEKAAEIYKLLVKEGKALTFLPGKEKQKSDDKDKSSDIAELPQPENDEVDARGIAKRHADHRLQTLLTSEGLQKRLLSLFYDAKTFEEEQGVNILYFAIGMLKWFEDRNSEIERHAPLLLIPVSLERGNAAERFKLRWREEDCAANLSLQAKMKGEFDLVIPDLPEGDELDISAYINSVKKAVSSKKKFEVIEDDMTLGFFSFAKFLMYRDLDPANWPEANKIDAHGLVTGLLQDGFPAVEGMIGEDESVDKHLQPVQMLHVVDADSSQTLAIEEVKRGRNLVIQGPPGTGKSQTITNIIATAVAEGKKVLFVAEKMAALEVVNRRMGNIGLGPLCLELHSHKANKRSVLEDLKRTKELSRPRGHDGNQALEKVAKLQEILNTHVETLHTVHQPSELSAFDIIGHNVRLKQDGVEVKRVVLEKPETWSASDKREREESLADVTARIKEIGTPNKHIWRGVCRSSLLPNEEERLQSDLKKLEKSLKGLLQDIEVIEIAFPTGTRSINSLNISKEVCQSLEILPQADYTVLAQSVWKNGLAVLSEIVQSGYKYIELKNKLGDVFSEAAWNTDLSNCRQQIALHGESILRFLRPNYRQSITLLKSLMIAQLPKTYTERLALVDDLITKQKLEKFLAEQHQAGTIAFGSLWQGNHSDWKALDALLQWRSTLQLNNLPSNFLEQCSRIDNIETWAKETKNIQEKVPQFFEHLAALFEGLKLNLVDSFEVKKELNIDRDQLLERLGKWTAQQELLSKWIAFKAKYDLLCAKGLSSLGEELWKGEISPEAAKNVFERAYYDVMVEEIFTAKPHLRNFDGGQHDITVANFRENDKYRIEQLRIELRNKHYNAIPKSDGGIGALGILNGEFARKRNHMPIRKLVKCAGPAIQALKPVFMMSPLSVAQFLEPGALQFDLLVMDEASQVEPVDALGAIARAKQVVVVGDSRQLPPTRFFARMTGDINEDEEDEDGVVATYDVESILNLCLARGLPERMLRWHYRSKHQSLIAVSNREFYDNKLYIVPSPYDAASGMGLKFNYLPKATFDSGGTATNPEEAKAVARAVIQHAKTYPNLSLGVGAFSIKQKQAIMDEIEGLRREHPETEGFFTQSRTDEPFFVKNLENIQGDERDVIFISVGYGKPPKGPMSMRFGPLSSEGGERRLNVLISRAKRRCEVFSSITADDIDLERGKGAGVAALKLFLKFAQTGKLGLGVSTDREADSIFEEQVACALRSRGYDVKTQIGIAGFFVDLAIVDPGKPGRFILGIECDGASYHSSRSARDRDRLRQMVLEDHGWIIHRVWSTDWFRRPKEQLERIIEAIERAKKTLESRETEEVQEKPVHQVFEISSQDDGELVSLHVTVGGKGLSEPYQEASFPIPSNIQPHLVGYQRMAEIVAKVVEHEGPIHEDEVCTRIRNLWNLARAGGRIQATVISALKSATKQGLIAKEGDFYTKKGTKVKVRDRSMATSPNLRKPEYLPPQEIQEAVLALVEENFGANYDQLPTEVSRLLGFKATSAQLKAVIEKQVKKLVSAGQLQQVGDSLSLKEARLA